MLAWSNKQRRRIKSLSGSIIDQWRGIEMAFNESDDPSAIIWRHPSVNAIQCDVLDALIDDSWLRFSTSMDDDLSFEFGTFVTEPGPTPYADNSDPLSIFRKRSLDCLPTGRIDNVVCTMSSAGLIAQVRLQFAGINLEINTAEVQDQGNSVFCIIPMDESLLIQVDGRQP